MLNKSARIQREKIRVDQVLAMLPSESRLDDIVIAYFHKDKIESRRDVDWGGLCLVRKSRWTGRESSCSPLLPSDRPTPAGSANWAGTSQTQHMRAQRDGLQPHVSTECWAEIACKVGNNKATLNHKEFSRISDRYPDT